MTQYSIYDEEMAVVEVPTENTLTSRQWRLYDYLKREALKGNKQTQRQMIEGYEAYLFERGYTDATLSYHYYEEVKDGKHFADMTSARQLREDLRALRENDTIQKIIVAGKIANTVDEAIACLNARKIKALKELKLYWKEVEKLEKQFQVTFVKGTTRQHIEAVLDADKSLEEIETELPF